MNGGSMATVMRKRTEAASAGPDRAENTEQLATLAKALGHPARIHIVRMLVEKQSCIGCDIVDELGLAQSTTSEHLRILKAAGIIAGEIERPRVCYSLSPSALEPLRRFLNAAVVTKAPASKSRS